MVSDFLKDRYKQIFPEVSGKDNVLYYVYTDGGATIDELTGDVTGVSGAFPATGIKLSALVDYYPSKAARAKIGKDIKYDATVKIPTAYLTDNSISPKVGDEITLPGTSERYNVRRVVISKQGKGDFLDTILAVKKGVGSRG